MLEDPGLAATLITAPPPVPLPVLLAVLLAVLGAEVVSALLPAAALARLVAVLDCARRTLNRRRWSIKIDLLNRKREISL